MLNNFKSLVIPSFNCFLSQNSSSILFVGFRYSSVSFHLSLCVPCVALWVWVFHCQLEDAWYANAWPVILLLIVHLTQCFRIEEPHLETVPHLFPSVLRIAPVARSSCCLFRCLSVCLQVTPGVKEAQGLDYFFLQDGWKKNIHYIFVNGEKSPFRSVMLIFVCLKPFYFLGLGLMKTYCLFFCSGTHLKWATDVLIEEVPILQQAGCTKDALWLNVHWVTLHIML